MGTVVHLPTSTIFCKHILLPDSPPLMPLDAEIQRLEAMSKQGESYSNTEGRYGWRNPIRADTGPLLTALVLAHAPARILEVGTAHGLSALHLAKGLTAPEQQHIDTIEFHDEVAAGAQERFDALGLPIRVWAGEAMEVIEARLEATYDLVFLDAQKSHYGQQFRALLERGMIGSGTVILADNVIDREVECTKLFQALEAAGVPYHVVPTECGLLVARIP